jgi:hypothetical protein
MADLPGGASGLRVRGYKGKEADRLVTHIDPGVVSLVAELRGHERQATEELEQWKTGVEERTPLDASPAAITLALLLTDEELDSLERGLEVEKSRGADDQVDQMSQALNRLRTMVSVPRYSPPIPRPAPLLPIPYPNFLIISCWGTPESPQCSQNPPRTNCGALGAWRRAPGNQNSPQQLAAPHQLDRISHQKSQL